MRAGGSGGGWRSGEFRIGAALLFLYALALLVSDPGWATWAGAMAVGALPMELPPSLSYPPADLFAGAGTLGVMGLAAFALIATLHEGNVHGWLPGLWNRVFAHRWHGGVPRRP